MGLNRKFFLSLGLVLFASGAARADVLELTQLGAQEVAKIEQAEAGKYGGKAIIQRHLDARTGSRFGFVRGMIIMEHGAAGDLAFQGQGAAELNNQPDKYFKFRPYNWVTRNGNNINWADYRFEWTWVSGVKQEIDTLDDLCMMVSWRCQAQPNGDPVAAMKRGLQWFAQQLDPANQLNVGGGGGNATNQAHEGTVTRYLLYGPMSENERYTRNVEAHNGTGPIGEYGKFDEQNNKAQWTPRGVKYTPMDPDWCEETPEVAVLRLVETIARCQKANPGSTQTLYNIPFSDQLQACSRLVAQFLTSDLANVPAPAAGNDDKANRIRAYAFRARGTLLGLIEAASPERVTQRRRRPVAPAGGATPPPPGTIVMRPGERDIDAQLRHSATDDDQPISIFDVASAALDVLLFVDQSQNKAGMTRPVEDDKERIVQTLLRVAAGAQAFNGGVQNLQIQDTIGYKARNTLALVAEGQAAEPFRAELVDVIANPANKMRSNAARSALVQASVKDGIELHRELDALFSIAAAGDSKPQETFYESPPSSGNYLPHSGVDPRREDACYVIKQLARRSQEGARIVRERIQHMKNRQTSGSASAEEKRIVESLGSN